MPPPDKKTILVTGDWVADWNLARPQNLPDGYFDSSSETQLHHRAGGAWYVAHLIENVVCRDVTGPPRSTGAKLVVKPLRNPAEATAGLDETGKPNGTLAHAYSIWSKHQRRASGKKDEQVWRIAQFSGCRKSTSWTPIPAPPGRSAASLLVIDDLGLGFSDQPDALAHVTSHAAAETKFLLKHGLRSDGTGILPRLLARKLGRRLHVVAAASALRRRNAALSQALSWDQVLEDIEAEFKSGPSSRDLALCEMVVVHFGLAGAAVFRRGKLHRMYFLPDEMEHDWELDRPGSSFGTGSILTACLARHLLWDEDYPLFFAVTQALAAQQVAHEEGAGSGDEPQIDLPYGPRDNAADPDKNPGAACIAPPPAPPKRKPDEPEPKKPRCVEAVERFRAAWNPKEIDVWPQATSPGLKRCRLLTNSTGTTAASLHAKAIEIVVQGPEKALGSVPKACYEGYLTADRDEIESINEIRRLILEYKVTPADKRPLSIAVFGAPGSGKSFAIKQVAINLFGRDKEPLIFNLTQMKSAEDLHRAFHQVRDASIRQEIPLVFWDEFDTAGLKWLADFLAPMQDAEFFDGSHRHPFGKCIFVFAGGTRETFEDFRQWAVLKPNEKGWQPSARHPWHDTFTALKGPDFISRLRGHVNVKGPNPTPPKPGASYDACIAQDPAYVLRRAIVLRKEIEKLHPQLIHPKTERAAIAPNVLHAFLSVERYEHGARSISAVLTMSALSGAKALTVSALPASHLLGLHVSQDFSRLLKDVTGSLDLHEPLARAGFEAWKQEKIKQGYIYGRDRNDDKTRGPLTHRLIKDWDLLSAEEKAGNYDPVWRRLLAIERVGCQLERVAARRSRPSSHLHTVLLGRLLPFEHEIWLADHLTLGYALGRETNDGLRLHKDIKPFKSLPRNQQNLNRSIVAMTLKTIRDAGLCVVRAK